MSTNSQANMRPQVPIHLLMPMTGFGTRFQKAGYKTPKPLVPINGVPMVERLLEKFPVRWPTTFVMGTHHEGTDLKEFLKGVRPDGKILSIPSHQRGPSFAVLSALSHLPREAPIFVSYCDYGMTWDSQEFESFVRETECDACVVSYRGFHAHYLSDRMYAFSRMEGERVREVREKGCFTAQRENEFASSGGYYFRTVRLLEEAIQFQIKEDLSLAGEFYTSLTVQALMLLKPESHVRVFEIPAFYQWGTPDDVKDFEYWESTFKVWNRTHDEDPKPVLQLLMPMAGRGSRFNHSKVPKPLISWDGCPMFLRAAQSFPNVEKRVFVHLDAIDEQVKKSLRADNDIQVTLAETPEGQALSTASGISRLNPERAVVVTACDHGVVLETERWNRFVSDPKCDAAIFTVKGFPGVSRKPLSYSYVITQEDDEFPIVERVSVKKNVTSNPRQEHLLVGTFWFRSPKVLSAGIDLLRESNLRVRGELYLDSVFDFLKEEGFTVRVFPLSGYMNWGDPESLAEAVYWQEAFGGRKLTPRGRLPGPFLT